MQKLFALEIDLIYLAQSQKMGGILSNLNKLDTIINPEVPKEVNDVAGIATELKNESATESTDSMTKTPVEPEIGASKEAEAEANTNTIVSDKGDDSKEKLPEEPLKEGKKVEVEPVDISKMTDVIKKPTRKRKRHQMA